MLPTSDSKQQGPFEVEKQPRPMTYSISTTGQPQASRVLYVNLLKEWAERPEKEESFTHQGGGRGGGSR